jgi:hypothetical protein
VEAGGESRRAGANDDEVVGIGFGHTRSILHQSRLSSFSDVVFEMVPEIYREGATLAPRSPALAQVPGRDGLLHTCPGAVR